MNNLLSNKLYTNALLLKFLTIIFLYFSSGSGRTGVFCALSIVVERMRAEGVVDLPETVRQLREQRPQMVETLEEYSFCYETALHYLSSFDHIA